MSRSGSPAPAPAPADLERRLREVSPVPTPDPRFRAELRTHLLATLERGPVADVAAPHRTRPRSVPAAAVRPRRHPGSAALTALGAAVAVLLVVTGSAFWLAQRALPGDALYGLKRVGESVDLSTKGGAVSRGGAYLSLSSTRIDEASELVRQASSMGVSTSGGHRAGFSATGPLDRHIDGLVHGVLTDGDAAAVTATRLLTTAAVTSRARKPTSTVSSWLADQRGKVGDLVARLPETAPPTAGGAARALQRDLVTITARIEAITVGVRCKTCRFTTSDRLGPLPCRTCPPPTSATPPTPSTRGPSATRRAPTPTTPVPRSTSATRTAAPSPTAPGSATGSGGGAPGGLPGGSPAPGATDPPVRSPTQPPSTPVDSDPRPPPTAVTTTPAAPGSPPPVTTVPPATDPPATEAPPPTAVSVTPTCLRVDCGADASTAAATP